MTVRVVPMVPREQRAVLDLFESALIAEPDYLPQVSSGEVELSAWFAAKVDGAFHMDVEHWEDDLARQRALTASDRIVVRCTARELRDEPERIARDLRLLGVPAA